MTTLLSVGRYVYCEKENHNEVCEKVKDELWRHYRTVALESHALHDIDAETAISEMAYVADAWSVDSYITCNVSEILDYW